MNSDIVTDSLRYYDENNGKYRKIKRKIKFIQHAKMDKTDLEGVRLNFYDADMNQLFVSRVEILGKYYNNIRTWVWGWSLPGINKFLTATIRNVFLYGTDIDINDNPANVMLRNELITSRFRIDDEVQLEIHCAIASYLAKKPFILEWKDMNIRPDGYTEIKDEEETGSTDVTYYTFIMDPPDFLIQNDKESMDKP